MQIHWSSLPKSLCGPRSGGVRQGNALSEFRAVFFVFLLGAAVAMTYTATWGGRPQFWQNTTFMQGLTWVCGQGWNNPNVHQVPGLAAFLDTTSDCLDCSAFPAQLDVLPADTTAMPWEAIQAYHPQPQFAGFLPWQRYHLYLVLAVTACWWAFGVCWSALLPLTGLLYGTSCAMGYGIFRLGMNRAFSMLGALLIITSPLHLQMAPHLRDYAKAPFTLAVILLLGLLLRRERGTAATLGLAALTGAAIGVGIGFRTDTFIVLPAAVAVVLLFLPGALRTTLRLRLGAATLLVAACVITGFPILLETFRESGHFCHVALLGFLDFCNARLGVASPLYQLGDPFTDFYLASVVQSYTHRVHGWMPPTWVMMPPYHDATQLYFNEYIRTFPADLVYRAWTSVLRVLDEMHPALHAPWPRGLDHPILTKLFELRSLLVDHWPGGGRYHAAAALAVIAAFNLRWALGALFILLYLAGYPSIQFNLRHAFHLEIFPVWAALFLAHAGWCAMRRRQRDGTTAWRLDTPVLRAAALRVIALGGLMVLAYAVPLAVLRPVQAARVGTLIHTTVDAPHVRLPVQPAQPQDEKVRVALPGIGDHALPLPGQADLPMHYALLALEFDAGALDEQVPVRFVFETENTEHWDFTRTLQAPLRAGQEGPTRIYFPLYYGPDTRFVGLELPATQWARLQAVYRVDTTAATPLWMTLVLPPDWEALPRYQVRTR
jgi:hypothetical protein